MTAHNLLIFALPFLVGACSSTGPVTERDPSPKPGEASDLRVVLDPAPRIEVRGRPLGLGIPVAELQDVLGEPAFIEEFPEDGSATAGTTYKSFEPGLSVRAKVGVVQGYYVYFEGREGTGTSLRPATPVLPMGLTTSASMDDVVKALGEPTRREGFEPMGWMQLRYLRGDALVSFAFTDGKFTTVTVELAAIVPARD